MVKLFVKLHVKWKEKTLNNETLCKTLQEVFITLSKMEGKNFKW